LVDEDIFLQILDGSISLISLISSEASLDMTLFELTFPFHWDGMTFQQSVPPLPSPMTNILRVFDVYAWILMAVSIIVLSAALFIAIKIEQHLKHVLVYSAVSILKSNRIS